MARFFQDSTCMVETRLVEKHTFLELEPQGVSPDVREDDGCGLRRRSQRAKTDSLVDYSPTQDVDNDVDRAPSSFGDCETMSQSSNQFLTEDFWDIATEASSSSDAESEGVRCTLQAQPCVATWSPQQHILEQCDATSHGKPAYHYPSLSSLHQWNQFPVAGVPAEKTCQAGNARLQAAVLEAKVAQQDSTCMVETRLVEKHTFLELEPHGVSPDAREDCGCGLRQRSQTDSLVDYSPTQIVDNDVDRASCSLGHCETMSQSSSQLLSEGIWDIATETTSNSSDPESEGARCTLQAQPCAAPSSPQHQILVQRDATSHGKPVYHYPCLPNSQQWKQLPVAGVPAEKPCQAANARLQAAELEAKVAQLELAAARLRVAAQQVATGTPFATTMPKGYWPVWKFSPSQYCQASVPRQAVIATHHEELTTVMLRNIPNDYTRTMLLELFDSLGLVGRYNFVYLPIDFQRMSSLGYAFVNLVNHNDAERAFRALQGFKDWKVSSQKVCEVCWSEPMQGLSAHVERYRSSLVMHTNVPDQMKPIVLQDGIRVPFPPPTKRIRLPRVIQASIHRAK